MPRYGFYSRQAELEQGSLLYETPDGATVIVTMIGDDPEAVTYLWEDKVAVGEVVRYVGEGRRPGIKRRVYNEIKEFKEPGEPYLRLKIVDFTLRSD